MRRCSLPPSSSATATAVRCSRRPLCPSILPLPVLLLAAALLLLVASEPAAGFLVPSASSSSRPSMVRRVPTTLPTTTTTPGPPRGVAAEAQAGAGTVHVAEGLRELAELYDVMLIDQWGGGWW